MFMLKINDIISNCIVFGLAIKVLMFISCQPEPNICYFPVRSATFLVSRQINFVTFLVSRIELNFSTRFGLN